VNHEPSTTGDVADVATFFRVSVRTVMSWKAERPPRLAYWQEGRNVCFGEEGVVALRVRMMHQAAGLKPGEAEAIARKEWREHLSVRSEFAELRERVARLEAILQPQNSLAA